MDERLEDLVFVRESCLEDQDYYVFRNTKGKLRFIQADNYRSFPLSPGIFLKGRFLEKGCAGNEIVELIHPYYHEKEIYRFVVVRSASVVFNEDQIFFVIVKDDAGNEFKIRNICRKEFNPGQEVRCLCMGQRKGMLSFSIM